MNGPSPDIAPIMSPAVDSAKVFTMVQPIEKPFIYLAAIRRSGSKLLSNLLSLPPHAFMFREVGLGRGNFNVGEASLNFFMALGVDIDAFKK